MNIEKCSECDSFIPKNKEEQKYMDENDIPYCCYYEYGGCLHVDWGNFELSEKTAELVRRKSTSCGE